MSVKRFLTLVASRFAKAPLPPPPQNPPPPPQTPPPLPPPPTVEDAEPLFQGDDQVFKDLAQRCTVYGEYGCGASTVWVARHSSATILSADTSAAWVETVTAQLAGRASARIKHVDLGPVGSWGRPLSYARHRAFGDYPRAIWSEPEKPDLVLIDGRFRVACFLYSVLHGAPGSFILFDDYVPREPYKIVEDILKPEQFCGRQAIFRVPGDFDRDLAEDLFERFLYVMD